MWFYIIFSFICFANVSSSDLSYKPQSHRSIDIFVERLKLEQWEEHEAPCLEKILAFSDNVKNFTLWATWIWNANTLPVGNLYGSWASLANFDQCMYPPWLDTHPQLNTKYCMADLTLSDKPKKIPEYDPYGSTEEFLNSPTLSGFPVNTIWWGLCVPAACKPSAIAKLARSMYDVTTYGSSAPNVTVLHCQEAGAEEQYGIGFYLFIALIVSLILTASISTYYRSYIASNEQTSDSLGTIITKSFCMVSNRKELVKEIKGEIRVMNGMRFISAAIIVIAHEVFYMSVTGIINSRDYDTLISGNSGFITLHVDVIVDTFLAMSGLLHIKGLMANSDRQQNLFKVLWKRYIRLIGPFAIIIFYLISVSLYVGSGPLWPYSNEQESMVCQKTWGLSLLMLNTDVKDVCHVVTWYLACDYQLAILGTVLFYFWHKNRKLGVAAFGTAAIFSLIIPAVLTYWLRIPAIPFLNLGRILREPRNYWELGVTYMPSYTRAGSYLVGIAMGYFMSIYKPENYRKSVSIAWSIFGTAVAVAVMLAVMGLGKFTIHREFDPLEAAVITATNRIVWAIAICCIIGLCEYGTVPIVSRLLGFSAFTPLSRLSYGIYMIHPLIIQRNKLALRSPWKFDLFFIITSTIGTLTTAIGLSYAMWLFVEAPVINLSNHFLFNKSKSIPSRKTPEQNGVLHQNGKLKTKGL